MLKDPAAVPGLALVPLVYTHDPLPLSVREGVREGVLLPLGVPAPGVLTYWLSAPWSSYRPVSSETKKAPVLSIIHGAYFLAQEQIVFLSSLLGVIEMGTLRFLLVTGQRLFPAASLRSNETRSQVVPVVRITGSRITLPEMGQMNLGGAFPSMAIRSSSRIGVV